MFKGIEFKDEQPTNDMMKGMGVYDLVKLSRFNGSTLLIDSINNEFETNPDYTVTKDESGRISEIQNNQINVNSKFEYTDENIIQTDSIKIREDNEVITTTIINSTDNIYAPIDSKIMSIDGHILDIEEYDTFCGTNYLAKRIDYRSKQYDHIEHTMIDDPNDPNRIDRIDYYKDADNIDYSLVHDADTSEFSIEKNGKSVPLSEIAKTL